MTIQTYYKVLLLLLGTFVAISTILMGIGIRVPSHEVVTNTIYTLLGIIAIYLGIKKD